MRLKVTCVVLFVVINTFSQRKYTANKYFQEFAYKKAGVLYENIYNKGDDSYLVLSRIADSFYLNSEFENAEIWYEKLINRHQSEVSSKHIFRYALTLKSNGKLEASDKWLLKLSSSEKLDRRALALEKNKNYFVEYTNRAKTFVNIHNLSSNSEYSDFGGFIHENTLYFSSTRPFKGNEKLYQWNDQPYLNIYSSTQMEYDDNKILDVNLPKRLQDINTKYHESNIIITKDGTTIYFTRVNYDGKKLFSDNEKVSHLKIYKATKTLDSWSDIEELPFNSDDYSIGHPALSPDEKTLYFVSDMPNGYGNTDIYKVPILQDGTYGEPVNLGETINTEGREKFPFIGDDYTLYFSSDGHLGLGALDIFESKLTDVGFSAPVNLGVPVNGPLDDFGFIINNQRSAGYFSSNREGGKGDDDIYSFTIYNCKEIINGVISDAKTGETIEGVTVKLLTEDGELVKETITKNDGIYAFEKVNCEKNFVVVASKDDYKSTQKPQATLDVNKKKLETNLVLESLIVDDQIVINPIYFDFNQSDIREDAEYDLEHIITVLKNHPEMVIRIESHTDSRGNKRYNRLLSDRRAKSTRNYILSRGISPERISSAIGYGEAQLLNECSDKNANRCSEEEHQENRRSYFYIVSEGKRK